ncbi:MAG: hypothetical protein Q7U47_07300 [Paludibacter sp.]|nr:hypothetical protein [Paludibacter sp.]
MIQINRTYYVLVLLLSTVYTLSAQNTRRNWSDGKLTWNDFIGKQSEKEFSGFRYFIEYKNGNEKQNDTTVVRFVTSCFLDRTETWTLPEYKTDQYLRFNQVMFNVVEIHRRNLQNKLDRQKSIHEADYLLKTVMAECKSEINRFKSDAKDGQNMKTIVLWEQITENKLLKLNNEIIPAYTKKDVGYGFGAGFGNSIFTGELNNYFSPAFNFVYGFDFSYKKSNLFLNATLGGNRVMRNLSVNEGNLYKGQQTTYAIGDLTYGYTLTNNSKLRLIPFAGIGFMEFAGVNRDTDTRISLNSLCPVLGLTADYKFKKYMNLIPDQFIGAREFVDLVLRGRLYVARADYNPNLQGYSVNLTVSVYGLGSMFKLKN